MKRIIMLFIIWLSICACSGVEEVTIIRSSLIVHPVISRPPVLPPTPVQEEEEDLPEEEEDTSNPHDSRFYSEYSKRLDMSLDGTENKALLYAIEEWIGTRYQMGGCSKSGVDCSCFVKAVYQKAYDVELGRSSADMFQSGLSSVRLDDLREGDLLFFKTNGGRIFHVGIYLKHNKFAHVSRLKGVKISSLDFFKKTLSSARRLKKKDEIISKTSGANIRLIRK